jgi:hypothetical protein
MAKFFELDKKFESKILIFGSYHPAHLPHLEFLENYLKESNFKNTFLVKSIIDLTKPHQTTTQDYIFSSFERIMDKYDYYLFILFESKNDSVIAELTTFIKSRVYNKKKGQTIVLIPYEYDFTMVIGLFDKMKLKFFGINLYLKFLITVRIIFSITNLNFFHDQFRL